mgnify:CR=1 FL=1
MRKKINSFLRNSITQKILLITLVSYLLLLAMIGILPDDTIFLLDIIYNGFFTFEIFLKLFGFGIKSNKKALVNLNYHTYQF